MSQAPASMTTVEKRAQKPPKFQCAEVWGGNRPVNGPFELPGLRGRVYSHPAAGGRGGDIHYVSICGSGLVSRICVADVEGHGEAVGRVSTTIHDLLKRHMNTLDQRRVLSALNARILENNITQFTTAAAVTYFPPTRSLSVSYAGHPPAWLYRSHDYRWERLRPASRQTATAGIIDLPLAVDPTTTFSQRKERVRPGDRLLLVTDGILEAASPAGELYGEQRLERLLTEHRQRPADDLGEVILAALREHTADPALSHDDVTLVLIEFVPGPKAFGIWHMMKNRMFHRPYKMLTR